MVIPLLNDPETFSKVNFFTFFFFFGWWKNHCNYVGLNIHTHWPGSLTELENRQKLAILRKKQKADE